MVTHAALAAWPNSEARPSRCRCAQRHRLGTSLGTAQRAAVRPRVAALPRIATVRPRSGTPMTTPSRRVLLYRVALAVWAISVLAMASPVTAPTGRRRRLDRPHTIATANSALHTLTGVRQTRPTRQNEPICEKFPDQPLPGSKPIHFPPRGRPQPPADHRRCHELCPEGPLVRRAPAGQHADPRRLWRAPSWRAATAAKRWSSFPTASRSSRPRPRSAPTSRRSWTTR